MKVDDMEPSSEFHEAVSDVKEIPREQDTDSVTRTEKFYPYFVHSRNDNKIIGTVYLTENQAYSINNILKNHLGNDQDIVFLRK